MHPALSIYSPTLTRPRMTSYYGGSSFHRRKHLQKSDRRVVDLILLAIELSRLNGLPFFLWIELVLEILRILGGFWIGISSSIQPQLWMEGSVPSDMLAFQQLRSNTESVTTPDIQTQYGSGDLSMNDLKVCLDEFVSVEDLAGSNSKCDSKDSDEFSDNLPDSTSSATLSKLASAMKGSREKQGIPPKKLSVTWAPDVYDPIPTSVSHVPSSRNQYIRNNYSKKYGKNKQRGGGKSSRGGKGKDKDKKQARKNGGTTTKVKSAASISEPKVVITGFNVISTDAFCGSSFLKESAQNLHFPVAEAMR
ncbi:uncharacterized protein LOC125213926 [Salvia hispanica]|uniref:uncharacterized protein LOC125213926 n=1 Tax=Salvia hispanica TaxID=49212 RepID=UPI0020090BAF|nr:uncharacterized protein LOC125213926 [Salvia hispanica]